MKKRIVLLGAPATGKGTQSELLSSTFGIPAASTGAIMREEAARGTVLGKEAQLWTSQGKLFPDELALKIAKHWIGRHKRFILDGFPRTLPQAEAFDAWLAEHGMPLDRAYLLELPDDVIAERVLGRLTCASCGSVFNVTFHRLTDKDECPICHGHLEHRGDDTPETLARRLAEYRKLTYPLIEYYRKNGILLEIDAIIGRDKIFSILHSDMKYNKI